jgi:hypothetical protein
MGPNLIIYSKKTDYFCGNTPFNKPPGVACELSYLLRQNKYKLRFLTSDTPIQQQTIPRSRRVVTWTALLGKLERSGKSANSQRPPDLIVNEKMPHRFR